MGDGGNEAFHFGCFKCEITIRPSNGEGSEKASSSGNVKTQERSVLDTSFNESLGGVNGSSSPETNEVT